MGALALQWTIHLIWQIIKMDPFNCQPLEHCVGNRGVVCREPVAFLSAIELNTQPTALKMMSFLKHLPKLYFPVVRGMCDNDT